MFTSLDDEPTQVPPPLHMLHSAVMSYLNRCPSHHTSFSEGKLTRFIHFRNTAEDLHSNRKTKKLFLSSFCSGFWEKHPTLLNFLWIKLIIFFFEASANLTAVMSSLLWVTALLMLVQGSWCVLEQTPKGCKSWTMNGSNVCCDSCHAGK